MRRLLSLVLALGLVMAACGSDGGGPREPDLASESDREMPTSSTSTSTTTTVPKTEATEAVKTYFDAIASQSIANLNDALDVVEPGSPAALYLRYFIAMREVDGLTNIMATTYGDDGTIEQCHIDFPDDPCATFSDVRSNDAGQVVTFKSAGRELGDRITAVGGPMESDGVTLTPIVAYETQLGDLFVVFDITNNTQGPVVPSSYDAVYVTSEGRQLSTVIGVGRTGDIQAGATAPDVVAFERANRPGTVTYSMFTADFYNEVTFQIAIP